MKLKVRRDILIAAMGRKFIGQKDLAQLTGLSLQTISDIVRDKRMINMKTAKMICGCLELSFEDLIIVEF
jgi:DNA-binding XRE family transcriptional regulator